MATERRATRRRAGSPRASAATFITALYLSLVPLLQGIVLQKAPRPMALLGLGQALEGLMLPNGSGAGAVGCRICELASAVAVAGDIVLIGFFAVRVDFQRITVVQLLTARVLGIGLAPAEVCC